MIRKIITILLGVLLVVGTSIGVYAAEKEIVIKGLYGVEVTEWPDTKELVHGRGFPTLWPIYKTLSVAMFETKYSNIKIEPMQWSYWGPQAGEQLRTGLAAGEAPAVYPMSYPELGGPQGMINEGLVADITDLVNNWEQTKYIPKVIWQEAWRSGRCYGIPHRMTPYLLIYYRKDWFKEAGIFNEKGQPAPPDNWTWDDFTEIARKLTNSKAERWGTSLSPIPDDGWIPVSTTFGAPILKPDPTGKYTWKAAFNLPAGVKVLQLYKDLTWKYKAAIAGAARTWRDTRSDFLGDRAGMITRHFQEALSWAYRPRFGSDRPTFEKLTGVAPYPRGPEGVRVQQTAGMLFGFNPTVSKEQLDGAFKWMDWLFAGPGYVLNEMPRSLIDPAKIKRGPDALLTPYHIKIGGLVTDPKTHQSAGYVIDRLAGMPSEYMPAYKKIVADPVKPFLGDYGLWEPNKIALETALQAAIGKVLTDPNADVQAELDKAAEVANKTALNVKLEGVTKESMKSYYTALGEFYQKNFPKYYEEVFQGLLEEYYKVW